MTNYQAAATFLAIIGFLALCLWVLVAVRDLELPEDGVELRERRERNRTHVQMSARWIKSGSQESDH